MLLHDGSIESVSFIVKVPHLAGNEPYVISISSTKSGMLMLKVSRLNYAILSSIVIQVPVDEASGSCLSSTGEVKVFMKMCNTGLIIRLSSG